MVSFEVQIAQNQRSSSELGYEQGLWMAVGALFFPPFILLHFLVDQIHYLSVYTVKNREEELPGDITVVRQPVCFAEIFNLDTGWLSEGQASKHGQFNADRIS